MLVISTYCSNYWFPVCLRKDLHGIQTDSFNYLMSILSRKGCVASQKLTQYYVTPHFVCSAAPLFGLVLELKVAC